MRSVSGNVVVVAVLTIVLAVIGSGTAIIITGGDATQILSIGAMAGVTVASLLQLVKQEEVKTELSQVHDKVNGNLVEAREGGHRAGDAEGYSRALLEIAALGAQKVGLNGVDPLGSSATAPQVPPPAGPVGSP